ncbi:MAG TPA: neuraminidase-like domain-containing protein [Flavilitoribacter sp.]|nr:neuraminidase-like domain-containing protein [Flavilitoribacter sp.]
MSGLSGQSAFRFVQLAKTPEAILEQDWADLVDQGVLAAAEVTRLKHTYASALFTDEDVPLMLALQKGAGLEETVAFPDLHAYAALDAEDWRQLLEKEQINPPQDVDRANYAQALHQTMEIRYPTQRLLSAVGKNADIPISASLLMAFQSKNPGFDLRSADLLRKKYLAANGSADLDFSAIPEQERPGFLSNLLSFQRVMNLGGDTNSRIKLLQSGFDSAAAITAMPKAAFMAHIDLPPATAEAVHEQAVKRYGQAQLIESNLAEKNRGITYRHDTTDPELRNLLKELEGWEEYFSEGPGCDCDDCNSLLSPAAYFVDLMFWVKAHLIDPNPSENDNDNARKISLRWRRPDLWRIPLDCESTFTEIPFLKVVNRVLGNYLLRVNSFGIDSEAQLLEVLRTAFNSFSQPYDLLGRELELYLSHFKLRRYDLWQALHPNQESQAQAVQLYFGLTPREIEIIAQTEIGGNTQPANFTSLAAIWGIDAPNGVIPGEIALESLLKASKISREVWMQLPEYLAPGAVALKGFALETNDEGYPVAKNLNWAGLHYLHRFIRLQRATGWSSADLDFILYALAQQGSGEQLGDLLPILYELHRLQEALRITVPELLSLSGKIPQMARVGEQQSWFEQRFAGITLNEAYRGYALDSKLVSADPNTALLLRSLRLEEGAFYQLLDALQSKLEQQDAYLKLSVDNLSLLYRYRLLMADAGLNPMELGHLIPVLALEGPHTILAKTLAFRKGIPSLQAHPFNALELHWLLKNGPIPPDLLLLDSTSLEDLKQRWAAVDSNADTANQEQVDLLAQFLQIDSAQTTLLLKLSAHPIKELLEASNGDLLEKMQSLAPWWLLIRRFELSEAILTQLSNHPRKWGFEPIGTSDRTRVPIGQQGLEQLGLFQQWRSTRRIEEAELLQLLVETPANWLPATAAQRATLARLLACTAGELQALVAGLPSPPELFLLRVKHLAAALALSQDLGLRGPVLGQITSMDLEDMQAGKIAVSAAIEARYTEPAKAAEILTPFQERTLAFTRDALVDYLLSQSSGDRFTGRDDLYRFFLLDTEMEDCARTSEVLSGISSLQLYVQRVFMNLEQTAAGVEPAARVAFDPAELAEVQQQWEWRKKYRVWEANRKIFLYPENSLEPDLRDDKTPFFRELEEELLQQEVTEEAVESALRTYLDKYTKVSKMQVAGSFFDPSGKLYLFCRTVEGPQEYYWRTVELVSGQWKNWSAWEKTDLPIGARFVTPIVVKKRLYVFWTEIVTRSHTSFENGFSILKNYQHVVKLKYSFFTSSKQWSPITEIHLRDVWDRLQFNEEAFLKFEGKSTCSLYLFLIDEILPGNVSFKDLDDQKDKEIITNWLEINKNASNDPIYKSINKYKKKKLSAKGLFEKLTSDDFVSWTPKYDKTKKNHIDPIEDYTLEGYEWERVYATVDAGLGFEPRILLYLNPYDTLKDGKIGSLGESYYQIDLFRGSIRETKIERNASFIGVDNLTVLFSENASHFLYFKLFNKEKIQSGGKLENSIAPYEWSLTKAIDEESLNSSSKFLLGKTREKTLVLAVTQGYGTINGNLLTISVGTDNLIVLFKQIGDKIDLQFERIGTTVAEQLGERLFNPGIQGLLSPFTQSLNEATFPITNIENFNNKFTLRFGQKVLGNSGYPPKLSFENADAAARYNQELFFHIPYLLAHQLNAGQRFAEAQRWWHYIFDPTSIDLAEDSVKRNWRYLPFREQTIEKLRQVIADETVLDALDNDPFNPYAAARTRLGAFQKAVIMRYIDNLLDWGDALFTRDTYESINEATLLYVLAAELLGERPPLGLPCNPESKPRNYQQILDGPRPPLRLSKSLENEVNQILDNGNYLPSAASYQNLQREVSVGTTLSKNLAHSEVFLNPIPIGEGDSPTVVHQAIAVKVGGYAAPVDIGKSMRNSWTAFCLPPNRQFLSYWDRVADRLFKIRNCQNIAGVRRALALYEPPLDADLLARLQATGLTLEQVYAQTEQVQHYRAMFLLERARNFVGAVQNFGNALLSALEKKDMEELS